MFVFPSCCPVIMSAMDRAMLEGMLSEGMSLENIGRALGKDHSTVGYWLKKHGLKAVHRERFAPKGGIEADTLRALVERRLTLSQMAAELGRSPGTVRYWLGRHQLETEGTRLRALRAAGALPEQAVRTCGVHGGGRFVLEGSGSYRCVKCRSAAVAEQRRRMKARLVEEAGGRCSLCGYGSFLGALHFHHLDPSTKEFGLGGLGVTRSIERLRREARKCVLLCSNCHAEVEWGVTPLPSNVAARV